VGYPIGEVHSFVTVVKDRLSRGGVDAECETTSYLPVTHVPRMIDAIRNTRPEVTILQLGNYETTVTFRKYFREKLGFKKAKEIPAQSHLPPETIFRQTWLWKAKCGIKLIADTFLRHDLVDFGRMESAFAELFDAIQIERAGEVIVLAPLPCADPLYMRYRNRLSVMMQRLARTNGFHFIPSPLGEENHDRYFGDATHLNALGQELLGNTVAAIVESVHRGSPQSLAVR
jgi:hypothetical protein